MAASRSAHVLRPAVLALVAFAASCGSDSPQEPAVLDPTQTVLSVPGGEPGVATEVGVELRDTEGRAYADAGPVLDMSVAGANAGAPTSVSSDGGGAYTLRYTPEEPGHDTLTVTLDGDPVPSSPAAPRVRIVFRAAEGTPTLDGVLGAGEWDDATAYEVLAGPLEGSTVRFMVDATDLHVALRMPDPELSGSDGLRLRFDTLVDLVRNGDDYFGYSHAGGVLDSHLGESNYAPDDVAHGQAIGASAGGWSVVEMSHPLDSGDPQDIAVGPGSSVGVCLRAWTDLSNLATETSYPASCNIISVGQPGYAELLIPEA